MINRKNEVKKNSFKGIFGTLILIVIVAGVYSYFAYLEFFPKEINSKNIINEKEYTFTIVKSGNIEEDPDYPGNYYVSVINKDNDVADVYVSEEKMYEIKSADSSNPVRFIGIASVFDKSFEGRDEYLEYLKEFFFPDMKEYYDVMLIEREEDKMIYFILAFVLVAIAGMTYKIILIVKSRNKALKFYDENPSYNEYEPKLKVHKYISIVKNYFISTASPAIALNLDECSNITLTRHRTNLITTHFSLSYFDSTGKRRAVSLPKIKKVQSQELINYLVSIGKYSV